MFYNAAVVIIALRSEEFSSMRIVVFFRSIHFWKKEKVGREKEEKGKEKGRCREERKKEEGIRERGKEGKRGRVERAKRNGLLVKGG